MVLNTELRIIQTTKEKIRHEKRKQHMLAGESLGKKVGNYLEAPNALTHRLFRNSVEKLETAEVLLLPSPPICFSCYPYHFFHSSDNKQATKIKPF